MARVRAADYDGKRRAILARSAALFAQRGYDRTSMAELAAACSMSKALLYHYHASKETLLFDILRDHLQVLIDTLAAVDRNLPPQLRLRALARALLTAYRDADHEHKIQINELAKLPRHRQKVLKDLERALVATFAETIAAVHPAAADDPTLIKPLTMSLFGMLNWHYLWFRDTGALSREDYADLAATLLIAGAEAAIAGRAPAMTAKPPARRAAAMRGG
jgi:TetR/AcrR family transcriptional regulator